MALQEAGKGKGDNNNDGLPLHWYNLKEGCCPKCGDVLISFDHLDLFKCTCGFKISRTRMEQILSDMEEQGDEDSFYNGFLLSPYDSDAPF